MLYGTIPIKLLTKINKNTMKNNSTKEYFFTVTESFKVLITTSKNLYTTLLKTLVLHAAFILSNKHIIRNELKTTIKLIFVNAKVLLSKLNNTTISNCSKGSITHKLLVFSGKLPPANTTPFIKLRV